MIYVTIKGRLGNQMFMYAFAYALSRENHDEPIVIIENEHPRLNNYELRNVSSRNTPFHRPLLRKAARYFYSKSRKRYNKAEMFAFEKKWAFLMHKVGLFYCENGYLPMQRSECRQKNIEVTGYFQCEKYFEPYKAELREIFSSAPSLVDCAFYQKVLSVENAVCMEVRLEDYINHPLHGVCTIEYYKKAMAYIAAKVDNPVFFVFSVNVDMAKEMLKDFPYPIFFEEGLKEDYEVLQAMSACRHFIISNSTFGFWGQYLATNDEKIVIAPSRWYNGNCPCDIYQENWTLMEP